MMVSRLVRLAVLAIALGGFGAAAAWSVRLGWADYWFRKETPEATEKALAMTPDQAAYELRLALLVGDDDPAKALTALRRAVSLNPNDGRSWVELGLRFEAAGDFPEAERSLLRAAEEDKTYLPRWTLLNYYFRRNQSDRFWFWAKAAVPMIYGDPLPLFHLCGKLEEDGNLIDRLEIRKPQIQAGYLFYLLDAGRPDLVGPVSRRLLQGNRDSDVPLLLSACDRLIEAQRVDDAAAIWNGLVRLRRIPFQDSLPGVRLMNGNFAAPPSGHGFDWRLPAVEGISAAREEAPSGLRLTFTGMQPEKVEALFQFVALHENATYELKFTYRTANIAPGSGLSWQIANAADGTILKVGEDLSSEEQVERQMEFTTPPGCVMIRLSMGYQRRPGTTRIAGFLVLRDVILR